MEALCEEGLGSIGAVEELGCGVRYIGDRLEGWAGGGQKRVKLAAGGKEHRDGGMEEGSFEQCLWRRSWCFGVGDESEVDLSFGR